MSGLPIRAKYRHFRTVCEHTFDISPTDFNSLKWWSSMHGVAILKNCSVVLFAFPRISLHEFLYHRTMRECLHQVSQNKVVFLSLEQNVGFKHFCKLFTFIFFACLTFSLSTTQINVIKEWCRFSQINVFHVFSTLGRCAVSFQLVLYRPHVQTRKDLFSVNE